MKYFLATVLTFVAPMAFGAYSQSPYELEGGHEISQADMSAVVDKIECSYKYSEISNNNGHGSGPIQLVREGNTWFAEHAPNRPENAEISAKIVVLVGEEEPEPMIELSIKKRNQLKVETKKLSALQNSESVSLQIKSARGEATEIISVSCYERSKAAQKMDLIVEMINDGTISQVQGFVKQYSYNNNEIDVVKINKDGISYDIWALHTSDNSISANEFRIYFREEDTKGRDSTNIISDYNRDGVVDGFMKGSDLSPTLEKLVQEIDSTNDYLMILDKILD